MSGYPSRLAEMAGGAVFKLGSFGNFGGFNQRDAGPNFLTTVGHRSRSHRSPLRRSSFAMASEDRGFAPARGDDGHDRSFITHDLKRT